MLETNTNTDIYVNHNQSQNLDLDYLKDITERDLISFINSRLKPCCRNMMNWYNRNGMFYYCKECNNFISANRDFLCVLAFYLGNVQKRCKHDEGREHISKGAEGSNRCVKCGKEFLVFEISPYRAIRIRLREPLTNEEYNCIATLAMKHLSYASITNDYISRRKNLWIEYNFLETPDDAIERLVKVLYSHSKVIYIREV
jgi:hypothetical protein